MSNQRAALPLAWCAFLTAIGACSVDNSPDWVEPRSALDRPGWYHAGFIVRVLDEQDRPVEATVSAIGPWAGLGRDRGLATTTTNEDGYAELRDVSSDRSLYISVEPSERLRPMILPLEGVSNGIADLGVLRLKRNIVITGTVKRVANTGSSTAVAEGSVSLRAVDDGERLGWAEVRDGWFRLDDFDVEPMEIEFDDRTPRTPDYRARLLIDPERQTQHFDLLVNGDVLTVEDPDAPPERGPVAAEVPTHRIALRFVDSEGEPIPTARVSVAGRPQEPSAVTDADGRVSMDTEAVPEQLYLSGPWGTVSIGVESPEDWELAFGGPPDVVADILGQGEIEIPIVRRVELEISGVDPQVLVYSSGYGRQWRTVDRTLVERVFDDRTWQGLLRVEAPGHLPRFAAYPVPGPLVFDFTGDGQHALVVVNENGPVAGVTVDLVEVATPYLDRVAVNDPEADIFLGSLTTDADGRLARLGDPRALYVAYVYAEGHDPARVFLQAGSETRVEIAQRDVGVEFSGLSVGERLRVKVAGRDSLVALNRVVDPSRVAVRLAPGTYDVSVENADSDVERGTTFAVGKDPLVVDTTLDRRPELLLRLPELPAVPARYRSEGEAAAETSPADRWIVWAGRRTTRGRPMGALAVTTFGGVRASETPVEVEVLDEPHERVRVLRFSGSGRWLVYLAAERRSVPHLYFVEVELAAGETRELEMPRLDASLEGAFERDLVGNTHGVAGPRMILIRAGGADAGWNVVNRLPREVFFLGRIDTREFVLRPPADMPENHDFAMSDLPAGEYHLFHHLGEDSVWGGVDVSLRAGGTARIPRLGSDQPGTWTVEVVDSKGRPVRDQVLRVRDRMHEAWAAYQEIPTTGAYAADGIPLPPAARLRGEPVSFESIRPGWVELVLDDPAGPARHYLRKAEPGSKLTLVVDD